MLEVPLLPSVIELSAIDSVGNGGGGATSLSMIVPVAAAVAMVAPDAPASLTEKVSLASTTVSPITGMVIVLLVSPAAKVSVPVLAV